MILAEVANELNDLYCEYFRKEMGLSNFQLSMAEDEPHAKALIGAMHDVFHRLVDRGQIEIKE